MCHYIGKGLMNILIVDDEELICWSLKRAFESYGHSVKCLFTGSEALIAVTQKKYDVIIADIKLPDMSGYELIKKIRALDIDVPIIAISAYFNNHGGELASMNVSKYINKPFQIEDIMLGIKEATSGANN